MDAARLLAIVEVSKEDRVICQARGCGHSVYKRIHVVRDNDQLVVLGSDCYSRLYEHLISVKTPRYGTPSSSRALTQAERQLLVHNTTRLIETFEEEHQQALQLEIQRVNERERLSKLNSEWPQSRRIKPISSARRLFYHQWLEQLSPQDRAAFELVRNRVREDMRQQQGIDPDLPGNAGWVNTEARSKFEKQTQDSAE